MLDQSLAIPSLPVPDLSSVKAIYFDLDDTLCGYWEASKKGLREAFREHPVSGYSEEELYFAWAKAFREFAPTIKHSGWYEVYLKNSETTRTEQMRRTLAQIESANEEHATRLSEAYMRRRDANLALFSDAIAVLTELQSRFPLGLITNGPADTQRQEIATLNIERFFQHFFIEGEMGEGKPNPTVFARAQAAVNVLPSEILMVGNSFGHDITPAIEAGWRTIWIRRATDVSPSSTGPEVLPDSARLPDAIVGSLTEVQVLLSKS